MTKSKSLPFSALRKICKMFTILLLINSCTESTPEPEIITGEPKERPGSIMAIFAHPDDETTVGPVLAKYASMGTKVYLTITTDGRFGVTDHFEALPEEELVAVRDGELACSCKALGIEPAIHLDLEDKMRSHHGIGEYFGQLHKMEDYLVTIIDSIRPEVIITFGPDGESGHPDHRMTSNVTTQVITSGKLGYQPRLYYWAYTKTQMEKYSGWETNYANEDYLDTVIPVDSTAMEQHYSSVRCYKSQFSETDMGTWIKEDRGDPDMRIFFRTALVDTEAKTAF